MRKTITTLFVLFAALASGQTGSRVISTAVPFLDVPSTAAGLSMGNTGVAMGGDDNSLFYNPAKIAFQKNIDVFSAAYIPWMREFSQDMKLVRASYSYRPDADQAFGTSLTYFNMGRLLIKDENGAELGNIRSNEFALSGTYARALTYEASVAVTLKAIYSRILNTKDYGVPTTRGAWGAAADLSFFRTIELDYYKNLRIGMNLANIGTRMSYSGSLKSFLPTNLRLGVGYDNQVNDDNAFSLGIDLNKLLVPTPPVYDAGGQIMKGKDPYRSYLGGLFSSLYDAPGGVKEELQEVNICAGGEYRYKDILTLRAGISYESKVKGNRSFIGAGVEYKGLLFDQRYDFAAFYLMPYGSAGITSPLRNTFGVEVKIRLGEE